MAVVFAQLITEGRSHGVHAFLVPIRDADGKPMPGVTIGDAGHKAGLLGVDNGRLSFDHVTRAAGHAAGPVRPGRRGRHLLQPDRERLPALLHHARHPGPGPGERRRRRVGGDQVGAGHRGALRRHPPPVRRPRRRPGGAAQRLPGPPAQAAARAGHHVRAALRPGRAGQRAQRGAGRRRVRSTSTGSGSWSPGPPVSRPRRPGTPPAPSRPAGRRAAAPATSPRTGCPA